MKTLWNFSWKALIAVYLVVAFVVGGQQHKNTGAVSAIVFGSLWPATLIMDRYREPPAAPVVANGPSSPSTFGAGGLKPADPNDPVVQDLVRSATSENAVEKKPGS